MMKARRWMLGLLVLVLAAGTAGPSRGSRVAANRCPVPDSGTCLGKLSAGTHTATSFRPKLTVTVPGGWLNYLDISGLYLLQPPGAKPPGNTIAGSFIGLETRVAPEAGDCQSHVSGVGTTPVAIAGWIARQHDLVVSNQHAVTVGGLRGVSLDVRMAQGAKGCLSAGATVPAAPLLVGVGPSSFDHEVSPGVAERHYLLAYKGGTFDIQMIDTSGGRHLPSYAAIVKSFHFAP
jgi:hypothetical protein